MVRVGLGHSYGQVLVTPGAVTTGSGGVGIEYRLLVADTQQQFINA